MRAPHLLKAAIPGLPKVILHHPVLSVTAGDEFLEAYHKAKNGEHGKGKNMHGKNGDDVVIEVPLGTIVKNSTTKQIIVDIVDLNQNYIIAKGGNGGFGNARYKTQKQTAPRIANDGHSGEEVDIDLELKVEGDIHRAVTGPSFEKSFLKVKGTSNLKARFYVSAAGASGTLAAGDYLKEKLNPTNIHFQG